MIEAVTIEVVAVTHLQTAEVKAMFRLHLDSVRLTEWDRDTVQFCSIFCNNLTIECTLVNLHIVAMYVEAHIDGTTAIVKDVVVVLNATSCVCRVPIHLVTHTVETMLKVTWKGKFRHNEGVTTITRNLCSYAVVARVFILSTEERVSQQLVASVWNNLTALYLWLKTAVVVQVKINIAVHPDTLVLNSWVECLAWFS